MAAYLDETIRSVLQNISPDDEYFIIDGGSTDGSLEIIKRYENRLSGWVSEPDCGYADAIHKGMLRGKGGFQCWINSGDILLKGALDQAERQLQATRADMIFGDDFYIDDESRIVGFSRGHCADLRGAMIYGDWTPLQDACFWRSDLYEKVGGLDVSLRNAADYDLFARFSVIGVTRYVPIAFSAFRRHEGQRSIAHGKAYREEKEKARQALISSASENGVSKVWSRIKHFLAVRWRVRVQHRLWDLPSLHGRYVSDFPSAQYWPEGAGDQSASPAIGGK